MINVVVIITYFKFLINKLGKIIMMNTFEITLEVIITKIFLITE